MSDDELIERGFKKIAKGEDLTEAEAKAIRENEFKKAVKAGAVYV